jgi:hypothetical protein
MPASLVGNTVTLGSGGEAYMDQSTAKEPALLADGVASTFDRYATTIVRIT